MLSPISCGVTTLSVFILVSPGGLVDTRNLCLSLALGNFRNRPNRSTKHLCGVKLCEIRESYGDRSFKMRCGKNAKEVRRILEVSYVRLVESKF